MMMSDPALDPVRKARCDISRELDNDPVRLIAHYAELQAHFKGRLIHGPEGDEGDEGWEDTARPGNAPDGCPTSPAARSGARG